MRNFCRRQLHLALVAIALIAGLGTHSGWAQSPWQTDTNPPGSAPPANVTIIPRSIEGKSTGQGQVSFSATLTEDGQIIEQGLMWRVFRSSLGPEAKPRLVSQHREAGPQVKLDAGEYIVNVAFGRANLTRKITVAADRQTQERFVLNAGGLRLTLALAGGEPTGDRVMSYDIYSDERDQAGQRKLVVNGARPGVIVRLNAGLYNVVSTYGDANAIARADVTVEAGKVTEATMTHSAAKVTFKLVTRPGGDALPDTQWTITTAQGELVKESAGALPNHVLAPGSYTVTAKNGGLAFQRDFTLQAGQAVQVEVLRR